MFCLARCVPQIRLEKERKEREKQKKKERVNRQKAAGTYLTPKQREQRARAQAMLEALKAQGAMIPALGGVKGEKLKGSSSDFVVIVLCSIGYC